MSRSGVLISSPVFFSRPPPAGEQRSRAYQAISCPGLLFNHEGGRGRITIEPGDCAPPGGSLVRIAAVASEEIAIAHDVLWSYNNRARFVLANFMAVKGTWYFVGSVRASAELRPRLGGLQPAPALAL